jgi:hypothetical protein
MMVFLEDQEGDEDELLFPLSPMIEKKTRGMR